MKKIYLIYAALIIATTAFWSGCSKNDDTSSDPNTKEEIKIPKEVFQLQIVEAQFSQPLLQEEYDADLGGIPLKVVRSNDNTLVFYVPGTIAVGETTLNIPQLEAKARFKVKKSVLNGSEDVVLKPFFEDLNFSQNRITDEKYSDYLAETLTAFKAYYKSLSNDDKIHMALFYQVNESWFKEILGSNSIQKFSTLGLASTFNSVKQYKISVLTFVTSGLIVVYGGTPVERSIAAVVCLASGALAWQFQKELVGEIKIIDKVVDQIIDPVFGNQIAKNSLEAQGLIFTNEEAQNVTLYTGNRSVTTADQSSSAEGTSIYFDAYGRLINTTEKVNNAIQFINDHVFFSNISLIPVNKIPDSAEIQSDVLTAEDYNSLQFTVADANVQLSDVAFENGAVRMKMTIKNSDAVTGNSIKTTLNYTYQNQFSNAKGSIPIEIKLKEKPELPELMELKGVWIIRTELWYTGEEDVHINDMWIDFKNGISDIAIHFKTKDYDSGTEYNYDNPENTFFQYEQLVLEPYIYITNVASLAPSYRFHYELGEDNLFHLIEEGASDNTPGGYNIKKRLIKQP